MQHIVLFVIILFTSCSHAGFTSDTMVHTQMGTLPITSVSVGHELLGALQTGVVLDTSCKHEKAYCQLMLYGANEPIICSLEQRFFDVHRQTWIAAKKIKAGQKLGTSDGSYVQVESVAVCKGACQLYELSVKPHHYFIIEPFKVLVHNVAPIAIGFSWALGSTVEFLGLSLSFFGGLLSMALHKKRQQDPFDNSTNFQECRSVQERPVEAQSVCPEETVPNYSIECGVHPSPQALGHMYNSVQGGARTSAFEQEDGAFNQPTFNDQSPVTLATQDEQKEKSQPTEKIGSSEENQEKVKEKSDGKKQKPLTNKEARERAKNIGWSEDSSPPKNIQKEVNSHGSPPVFKNPKKKQWVSPDQDNHSGGGWKEFDRKGRIATLDKDFRPIGK